jgi:hypothetical protein
MNANEKRPEDFAKQKLLTNLPRSVKVGFVLGTLLFVFFEIQCLRGLWTSLWLRSNMLRGWVYPCFILAPWAYCARGLARLSRTMARREVDDATRVIGECLVGMLVFSYLLAWQWSEFILAASKAK